MAELTAREMASLGGKARAKKLTAEQRSEAARKAVQARWQKALTQLEKKIEKHDRAARRAAQARSQRAKQKKESK